MIIRAAALAALALLVPACGSRRDTTTIVTVPATGGAGLSDLSLSTGPLTPAFDPAIHTYGASVGALTASLEVTATASDPGATLLVDGMVAPPFIALAAGVTEIVILAIDPDGREAEYRCFVTRPAQIAQEAFLKATGAAPGDNFGITIGASGETVVVGADNGSAYVLVDGVPQATLTPPAAAEGFGASVAVDGDTIVVGDANGSAFVYVRSGATWSWEATLTASDAAPGDSFGVSVGISGDSIVVGAMQHDVIASESGAAYVYVRSAGAWTEQAILKAAVPGADDWFGYAVAISGDLVAVGSLGEDGGSAGLNGNEFDNSKIDSGAAYVFARDGVTWSQEAYVKASNVAASDLFGRSVAIDGSTLAVGATYQAITGAVYVYARVGAAWHEEAFLKSSTPGFLEFFGFAVALSGDALVVGELNDPSGATGINGYEDDYYTPNAGAAYLFIRSGGTWTQTAYIKASNTTQDSYFGAAVALSGELIAIGAPFEGGSGAAYLFR